MASHYYLLIVSVPECVRGNSRAPLATETYFSSCPTGNV